MPRASRVLPKDPSTGDAFDYFNENIDTVSTQTPFKLDSFNPWVGPHVSSKSVWRRTTRLLDSLSTHFVAHKNKRGQTTSVDFSKIHDQVFVPMDTTTKEEATLLDAYLGHHNLVAKLTLVQQTSENKFRYLKSATDASIGYFLTDLLVGYGWATGYGISNGESRILTRGFAAVLDWFALEQPTGTEVVPPPGKEKPTLPNTTDEARKFLAQVAQFIKTRPRDVQPLRWESPYIPPAKSAKSINAPANGKEPASYVQVVVMERADRGLVQTMRDSFLANGGGTPATFNEKDRKPVVDLFFALCAQVLHALETARGTHRFRHGNLRPEYIRVIKVPVEEQRKDYHLTRIVTGGRELLIPQEAHAGWQIKITNFECSSMNVPEIESEWNDPRTRTHRHTHRLANANCEEKSDGTEQDFRTLMVYLLQEMSHEFRVLLIGEANDMSFLRKEEIAHVDGRLQLFLTNAIDTKISVEDFGDHQTEITKHIEDYKKLLNTAFFGVSWFITFANGPVIPLLALFSLRQSKWRSTRTNGTGFIHDNAIDTEYTFDDTAANQIMTAIDAYARGSVGTTSASATDLLSSDVYFGRWLQPLPKNKVIKRDPSSWATRPPTNKTAVTIASPLPRDAMPDFQTKQAPSKPNIYRPILKA